MERGGTDWVALAGIGAAAGVGIGSAALAARSARQQREHERRLARDARVFDGKRDAYRVLMKTLSRWMQEIETVEPLLKGGQPPVIEPIPQDQIDDVNAGLATFGSDEVRELLRAWRARRAEFVADIEMLRWAAGQKFGRLRDWESGVGRTQEQLRRDIDSKRQALRDAYDAVGRLAQTELV